MNNLRDLSDNVGQSHIAHRRNHDEYHFSLAAPTGSIPSKHRCRRDEVTSPSGSDASASVGRHNNPNESSYSLHNEIRTRKRRATERTITSRVRGSSESLEYIDLQRTYKRL